MSQGVVKLQINELGSWRNALTAEETAENEQALIDAAQHLRRAAPEHVTFRLLYPDGHHEHIAQVR